MGKQWVESGGKGCMYIKDWFKPIFPIFLIRLLNKLKFLIPTVDFASLPPAQSHLPSHAYAGINLAIFSYHLMLLGNISQGRYDGLGT